LMGSSRSIVRFAKKGGGQPKRFCTISRSSGCFFRMRKLRHRGWPSGAGWTIRIVFIGFSARIIKLWGNATGAITYKGKNSDEAVARRSSCLFDYLRECIAAGHCSPTGTDFAGADGSAKFAPPTSPRSPKDRMRIRAQLRLGFGNRRKTNTEDPNSAENGTHRRKAPAPMRVGFAGADARTISAPPPSPR
jgi:hypothetical protein